MFSNDFKYWPKRNWGIDVGTDDGLIQVTENDGQNWRKIEKFVGVPDMSYVARILASQHNTNTVYALFNNHQNGDFKPYVLKSTDVGRTWTSIKGNLPERGSLYAIAEDHINPDLLFVGTEFGVFFSLDGGAKWVQMRGGLPTIAVRDIAIQKTENDLVLGTFGRGIYILDDYSPLRQVRRDIFDLGSNLFPVKDALMYVRSNTAFTGSQGATLYTAPNPAYGATFTYYLKESPRTLRQRRQEAERAAERRRQPFRYPSIEELRREAEEEPPTMIFTITDAEGKVVRRLNSNPGQGIQRVVWDMRYTPPSVPATPPGGGGPGGPGGPAQEGGFGGGFGPQGPLVMPGKYTVTYAMRVNGVVTALPGSQSFNVIVEGREKMTEAERVALTDFQRKVSALQRNVNAASDVAAATKTRIGLLKRAALQAPVDNKRLIEQTEAFDDEIDMIVNKLRGGRATTDIPPPSISSRVNLIAGTIRLSTVKPTQTQVDQYELASSEFAPILARLKALVDVELPRFEKALDDVGAPLTPGRLPK